LTPKNKIESLSDEELLALYLVKKESHYLGILLDRHVRFVFVVCMKYLRHEEEARDMSMHVFEKVLADVHRFEIRNFKSWLHVVTRNCCLMHIRENKKLNIFHRIDEKESYATVESRGFLHPDEEGDHEEQLTELERSIGLLEEGQKECIELFYLKEKSYKEVAEITGYTMNQVKSYIQNGKRNLKNLLIKDQKILLMLLFCIYFNGV
jgi:RNA polymerase sigma factor (sigma-70 family)